jgi:type IV fimbrial biogenesis protein FimT
MLSQPSSHRQHGFTLIELMITIAILGIVIALGVPSYSTWIQNTQIRSSAESIQNGLQLARAEAVRRNVQVQFVLTDDPPTVANVGSVTLSTSGRNWLVRVYQSGGAYSASDFIQGRARSEGSTNATVTAGQSNITFTSLGRLPPPVPTSDILIDITTSAAGVRNLRIVIRPGGLIRMCDPNLPNTNIQGC